MVYKLLFSPTGGTAAVANALTDGQIVDLTDRSRDFSAVALTAEDVAVIAVPSYAGRVPKTAAARLAEVQGGGARAVLVCVYGNRAYEDTLVELADLAEAAGFRAAAGIAALAEHSIARTYAAGRPDAADKAELHTFWEKIEAKLRAGDATDPRRTDADLCIGCMRCVALCPVQARQIDPDALAALTARLAPLCAGHKENELFL